MSEEPTGYRTMLQDMVEELEGRPWPPPTRYTNILIALAVIEELYYIGGRLEELNATLITLTNTIADGLATHTQETAKRLSRIGAEIPLAGKGP